MSLYAPKNPPFDGVQSPNPALAGLAGLDARARDIFRRIVESYLETGEPVGSRTLSLGGVALSPASIRNTMQDLTLAGLLASPHASAGRIPTHAGLRLFVDGLLEVGDLPEDEAHDRREVRAVEVRGQRLGNDGLRFERVGEQMDLRPVAVVEENCPEGESDRRGRGVGGPRTPSVHLCGEPAGDEDEELLLVPHVPVERRRLHLELTGEATHREVAHPELREHRERGVGDRLRGQRHGRPLFGSVPGPRPNWSNPPGVVIVVLASRIGI